MMCLFDEIEAKVRNRARKIAEDTLDAIERGSLMHVTINGVEVNSVSVKFDPEARSKYIDSKEREAIRLLKQAIVESVALED
jgi:DNA-binding protein YbaB